MYSLICFFQDCSDYWVSSKERLLRPYFIDYFVDSAVFRSDRAVVQSDKELRLWHITFYPAGLRLNSIFFFTAMENTKVRIKPRFTKDTLSIYFEAVRKFPPKGLLVQSVEIDEKKDEALVTFENHTGN